MASLRGTDTLPQIAKALGVPYDTLFDRSSEPGFPAPVATIATLRLYRMVDVAVYLGMKVPGF
jgi:hypothetical protein